MKSTSPAHMSSAEFQRQYGYAEKNPYKVYQGKKNKKNGDLFETYLKHACQKYSDDMFADVGKANEPLRIIARLNESGARPTFKCVLTGKADPDFKGMLNTGRAVGFEAKHTDAERIDRNVVTQHQTERLNRYSDMGAITFVVVSFGLNKFYRLPWTFWRDMKNIFGHPYITQEDLRSWEIPVVVYEGKPAVLFLDGIDTLQSVFSNRKYNN